MNVSTEVIEAARSHWMLIGAEMQSSDGIRIVAAAEAIKIGITELDGLYGACMDDVGDICWQEFDEDHLELVKAKERGLRMLSASLALHGIFGANWLLEATSTYLHLAHNLENPMEDAYALVEEAWEKYAEFKERDSEAVRRWLHKMGRNLHNGNTHRAG